jgi:hypothetical protein
MNLKRSRAEHKNSVFTHLSCCFLVFTPLRVINSLFRDLKRSRAEQSIKTVAAGIAAVKPFRVLKRSRA